MISSRTFAASMLCAALFSSAGAAQDLAKYRDFQFGMSVKSVAEKIHVDMAYAKTTYQRPALIQTLQWDQFGYSNVAVKPDSIRNVRFDFYNGELSKMVVTYDPVGTEGLTTDDLIEAIRSDKPYNEVERGAKASLVTSMGRMAAHTGQIVTFDQMMNCEHEFAPDVDKLTLDGPAPLQAGADGRYPVPQPGIIKNREY